MPRIFLFLFFNLKAGSWVPFVNAFHKPQLPLKRRHLHVATKFNAIQKKLCIESGAQWCTLNLLLLHPQYTYSRLSFRNHPKRNGAKSFGMNLICCKVRAELKDEAEDGLRERIGSSNVYLHKCIFIDEGGLTRKQRKRKEIYTINIENVFPGTSNKTILQNTPFLKPPSCILLKLIETI